MAFPQAPRKPGYLSQLTPQQEKSKIYGYKEKYSESIQFLHVFLSISFAISFPMTIEKKNRYKVFYFSDVV